MLTDGVCEKSSLPAESHPRKTLRPTVHKHTTQAHILYLNTHRAVTHCHENSERSLNRLVCVCSDRHQPREATKERSDEHSEDKDA